MNRVDLAEVASELLDYHKESLLIDPFVKISIEIVDGDFVSVCEKVPSSPLSWVLKINPERHSDLFDVHYSVLSGLITTLFSSVYCGLDALRKESLDGAIARLSAALAQEYADEEGCDEED